MLDNARLQELREWAMGQKRCVGQIIDNRSMNNIPFQPYLTEYAVYTDLLTLIGNAMKPEGESRKAMKNRIYEQRMRIEHLESLNRALLAELAFGRKPESGE